VGVQPLDTQIASVRLQEKTISKGLWVYDLANGIVLGDTKMKWSLTQLLMVVVLTIPLANGQQAARALPDDNLAYPVLVTIGNSKGSGFYLSTAMAMYLVTATHVLFDPFTGRLIDTTFSLLSYSRDLSDQTSNIVVVDTKQLPPDSFVRHQSQDVTVVRLFQIPHDHPQEVGALPGVTIRSLAKAGFLSVPLANIKTYDKVLIGNDVVLLGYPTSLGLQAMPQLDSNRPLLRKGIVAGENPRTHSIILDCPAYFGNSGGPVIEVDQESLIMKRYNIIGVVDQYIPYLDAGKMFAMTANSGYSIAVPMDYVLELVK
jgi:hypothetical protein